MKKNTFGMEFILIPYVSSFVILYMCLTVISGIPNTIPKYIDERDVD
jgi:hypothetical protein